MTEHVAYRRPSRALESMEGTRSARQWRVVPRWYEIVFCHHARATARYRARELDVISNCVYVLEPGNLGHTYRVHVPADFQVLFVEPNFFRALLPRAPSALHFKPEIFHAGVLAAAIRRLHAMIARDADPLALEEALSELLPSVVEITGEQAARAVVRSSPRLSRDVRGARRVVDYLHAHLAEAVSLQALVRLTGTGRFRLIRSVKSLTGATPHQYLIQLRIARARDFLSAGCDISTVARKLGFADQSHFHRNFRRVTGVTPGQYKRMTSSARRSM